jgi:hypothetical protein
MTLPKRKILNATRGVIASANMRYASPKQSQCITVNITPSGTTEVKDENLLVSYGQPPMIDENPYANLVLPNTVEEYERILSCKDKQNEARVEEKNRQLEALNLVIEIIKSNPILVDKFVIASEAQLFELIKLLTNTDLIEFKEKEIDVGCSCSFNSSLMYIEKIYVQIRDEVHYLKQKFPCIIRLLDEHKISYKIVKIN